MTIKFAISISIILTLILLS